MHTIMMLGACMLGATAGLLVMATCRVAAEADRIDERMRQ
jgi:hypothetical protein